MKRRLLAGALASALLSPGADAVRMASVGNAFARSRDCAAVALRIEAG